MDYSRRFDGDLARRKSRDELIEKLAATHDLDVCLVRDLLVEAERGQSRIPWWAPSDSVGLSEVDATSLPRR